MSNGRQVGEVILDLQNISLRFGGVKALTDISFDVREHEIVALLGRNGAGKSTLLKSVIGITKPASGSIRAQQVGVPRARAAIQGPLLPSRFVTVAGARRQPRHQVVHLRVLTVLHVAGAP